MAIGISYTGHDGRRADFTAEGNPAPGSELDRIVRGADAGAGEVRRVMNPLTDAMRRARRPQGPDPRVEKAAGTVKLNASDHRPGTLDEKVARDGSIEAGQAGLKLKGEDGARTDGIYAKKNGAPGFMTLDQIDDPKIKGGLVGEPDGINRLAPSSNKAEGESGAFATNMQSRTEAEVNEETGEVTFWEYTKRLDVTNGRRVGGVSGETKRKICSFFLEGGERQITYTVGRTPFTILRSRYKDKDGKTRYEYWARCLKWIDPDGVLERIEEDPEYVSEDETGVYYESDMFSSSGIVVPAPEHCRDGYSKGGGFGYDVGARILRGVYPKGVYGHYPVRPNDRPRKLVFDSGREALVDFFEERDCSQHYNEMSNCWTYVGCSDDFQDGKAVFYGYMIRFVFPYKTRFVERRTQTWAVHGIYDAWPYCPYELVDANNQVYNGDTLTIETSSHWEYAGAGIETMVVTKEKYDTLESLVDMLAKNGAYFTMAAKHDGFDEADGEVKTFYLDGVKIAENVQPLMPQSYGDFHTRWYQDNLWDIPSTIESVKAQSKTTPIYIGQHLFLDYTDAFYVRTIYRSPDYDTCPLVGFGMCNDWFRNKQVAEFDPDGKLSDSPLQDNFYAAVVENANGDVLKHRENVFGVEYDIDGSVFALKDDIVAVGKEIRLA